MLTHQISNYRLVNFIGGELCGSIGKNSDHLGPISFVQSPQILKFDYFDKSRKHPYIKQKFVNYF